ncbi:MAG TPA: CoA transferase [Acidimicrobiales bacterium]|nr:CoA transferase [Acidimicrobiales bacterium]
MSAQPLKGFRVVDLTTNMSGPLATMVLADEGADVVKVEPLSGDVIRTVGTGVAGMSAYFANVNRAKRSIAVDLSRTEGRDLVLRLCSTADVFTQNFRPGVVDRLGLGSDTVMAANPTIVYASISGFGDEGPLATAPAYDHVVQALSGFAALQSEGVADAAMVRHGVIDKATAYSTAQAITAALLERTKTGKGSRVDVSMLDVALAFVWPDGMMNHTCSEPDEVLPPVHRSFKLTPTADGHVSLVTLTAAQWQNLVDALADPDEAGDLSDTAARMSGGAAIMRAVRAKVATMTTAEVVRRLQEADVPCAPVLQLDELWQHEQIAAVGAIRELDHAVLGPIRQPRPAPRFDGDTQPTAAWAPTLGQHTDEVLGEAGLSSQDIDALRADKVIG